MILTWVGIIRQRQRTRGHIYLETRDRQPGGPVGSFQKWRLGCRGHLTQSKNRFPLGVKWGRQASNQTESATPVFDAGSTWPWWLQACLGEKEPLARTPPKQLRRHASTPSPRHSRRAPRCSSQLTGSPSPLLQMGEIVQRRWPLATCSCATAIPSFCVPTVQGWIIYHRKSCLLD